MTVHFSSQTIPKQIFIEQMAFTTNNISIYRNVATTSHQMKDICWHCLPVRYSYTTPTNENASSAQRTASDSLGHIQNPK